MTSDVITQTCHDAMATVIRFGKHAIFNVISIKLALCET